LSFKKFVGKQREGTIEWGGEICCVQKRQKRLEEKGKKVGCEEDRRLQASPGKCWGFGGGVGGGPGEQVKGKKGKGVREKKHFVNGETFIRIGLLL